jgi:hypothetical protein
VEQLAGCSDTQVQGIGHGGLAIREKARRALAEKNAAVVNSEVAKRDAKIADLEDKLNKVLAMVDEKRGPGRPRKEAEAA